MSLIKLAEQNSKVTALTDEQLTDARRVLSRLVSASRTAAGKRQVDVFKEVGLNNATQSRIETGAADFRVDGMLQALHASGALESLLDAVSNLTPESNRTRVKSATFFDESHLEGDKTLSSAAFQAIQEKHPGVELPVSSRAAVFLSRSGYAVRSAVVGGETVIYATTLETALESEHEYQAPTGETVGGIVPLNVQFAANRLTNSQYFNIKLHSGDLADSANDLFRAQKAHFRVNRVTIAEQGDEMAVITLANGGHRVELESIYSVVVDALNGMTV